MSSCIKRGWGQNRVQITSVWKINITIVRTLFSVSMASYQPKYMGFSQIPNFHFFQFFKNPKGGPFALKKSNFLSGAPRGNPGVPKIGYLVKTHIFGLVGSHTDTK